MSFNKVLITIDIDCDVDVVVALARRLATKSPAAFSVLGVMPEFPAPVFKSSRTTKTARHLSSQLIEHLTEKVDKVAAELPENSGKSIVSGRLVEEVAKAVMINQADLVVKAATLMPGESGPLFGSIDKRLIRNSPCPVWVVRPDIDKEFDHIAVAIDRHDLYKDSDARRDLTLSLLEHAAKLAKFFGIMNVDVIYAWDAVGADMMRSARSGLTPQEADEYMQDCEQDSFDWMDDFLETVRKKLGSDAPNFIPQLAFGRPRQVLISKVHELKSDVLIIGTIARSGALGLLMGNTAEDVLDRVECSVMAIKPDLTV